MPLANWERLKIFGVTDIVDSFFYWIDGRILWQNKNISYLQVGEH
jgi:hypothetical protein